MRHRALSPCFWSGPGFAEGIMASGPCAAPTGRRHGRTDQRSQNSQVNLANGEPSRHGADGTMPCGASDRGIAESSLVRLTLRHAIAR